MKTTLRNSNSPAEGSSNPELPADHPTHLKQALIKLYDDSEQSVHFPLFTDLCKVAKSIVEGWPESLSETRWRTERNQTGLLFVEVAFLIELCSRRALPVDSSDANPEPTIMTYKIQMKAMVGKSDLTLNKVIGRGDKYFKRPRLWELWLKIRRRGRPYEYFHSQLRQALEPFEGLSDFIQLTVKPPADLSQAARQLLEGYNSELPVPINADSEAPQIDAYLRQLKNGP
ncbi:hypothetical protein AAF712_003531 [Marasmius tenuissimus]|uniref:Uncharacterized protein n=1 Tax=Marasmius tenuissimus TaxID=585030 RepID=A0ABR3A842_9AGAR